MLGRMSQPRIALRLVIDCLCGSNLEVSQPSRQILGDRMQRMTGPLIVEAELVCRHVECLSYVEILVYEEGMAG
jgi:hypothetical protein